MTRSVDEAFDRIGLPPPEIPARWATRLKEQKPWLFFTGNTPWQSLRDINGFFEEALSGEIENGLLISFELDDANKWVVRYYLIEEEIVLLLELPWDSAAALRKNRKPGPFARLFQHFRKQSRGNPPDEPSSEAQVAQQTFAALPAVLREFERIRDAEHALPGRLAVVLSGRSTAFWGWGPHAAKSKPSVGLASKGSAAEPMTDWITRFDDDVMGEALKALRQL